MTLKPVTKTLVPIESFSRTTNHKLNNTLTGFCPLLTNLIYTSDHLGNETMAKKYLEELRKWEEIIDKTGEADLKSKYFSTLSSIELSLLSKHGEYTELADKIPNIETGIHNFENQLTEIRKSLLLFQNGRSKSRLLAIPVMH